MSIKKKFLKVNPVCRVTFKIKKGEVNGAKAVNVLGDFNDWNDGALPMKKLKNGDFTATIDLDINREFQFRYLLDKVEFENDWEADRYVPSVFGNCENSVVIT